MPAASPRDVVATPDVAASDADAHDASSAMSPSPAAF